MKIKIIFNAFLLLCIFHWNALYSDYFVCDTFGDSVYVLDLKEDKILARVDDARGAFQFPLNGAWDHKTSFFVPNEGNHTISIIDINSLEVIGTVSDPGSHINRPNSVVITPDGKTGFISLSDNDPVNIGKGGVGILDVETQTVTGMVPGSYAAIKYLGYGALTPDGSKYIVAGQGASSSQKLLIVDVASKTITKTVTLRDEGYQSNIAITPDGQKALISCGISALSILDIAAGTITRHTGALPGGAQSSSVLFNSDGTKAIVLDYANGGIYSFDMSSYTSTAISPGFATHNCNGIVKSPDGKKAYFGFTSLRTGGDGAVGIIDLESLTVTKTVDDSLFPFRKTWAIGSFGESGGGGGGGGGGGLGGGGNGEPPLLRYLDTIKIKARENTFLSETNHFVELSWNSSLEETYQILRDLELIGTVQGQGPLKFVDNNLRSKETYTYRIVLIDSQGDEITYAERSIKTK